MDIRIGLTNVARELSLETAQSKEDVETLVSAAIKDDASVLKLTDVKGKVYLIPSRTIAFVEFGVEEARRVGFVN
ncbi:MAG: DUF3107 domain-containing protein [Microbacteriaceae bacterium]